MDPTSREDNIIAALEHNNRVSNLELCVAVSSQWENILAAMQVPFPTPTDLVLKSAYETAPIVPDTVFGWICTKSAISLVESRSFSGITGAAVVATGTHLVYLQGYISTQAMASCLSALTSSKNFGSHSIHLDLVRTGLTLKADVGLCPHAVLPDLIRFRFRDMSEYLEDLAARVDAPLLHGQKFTLYHRLIFDTSNTSGFISRAPKFKAFDEARVAFDDWEVSVTLLRTVERLLLGITSRKLDRQLSSLVHFPVGTPLLLHEIFETKLAE